MKLAIVVLAHDRPEHLARLLSAVRDPAVRVYLHVDRRVPLEPFSQALTAAGLEDVALLPRQATSWASPQLVDAALEGLKRGVADGCGYFLLLSGRDFPLRPAEEIVAFAEGAGSRSYLEHFPLPDPRWRLGGRDRTDFYTYTVRGRRETCIPRGEDTSYLNRRGGLLNRFLRLRGLGKPARRFPSYARAYGGSQWWNLSRDAASHVLAFLERHPDYRRYHEHTLAPDEIFFQSILAGTGFAERAEVVDDSLRFMRWPVEESHPRVLGVDDLPAILASGALFARKFDPSVDAEVLERLAERVSA
ncbi:MAG TPA: beta-1,6-N-acetylglucosaminyltransferase [Solirubrobacterales bacterium]